MVKGLHGDPIKTVHTARQGKNEWIPVSKLTLARVTGVTSVTKGKNLNIDWTFENPIHE